MTMRFVPLALLAVALPVAAHAGHADHAHPHGGAAPGDLVETDYAGSGWLGAFSSAGGGADGLLVDFADHLSDAEIEAIEKETGLDLIDTTDVAAGNLWLFRGSAADMTRAMKILAARKDVESVEPNVYYSLFDQDLEAGPVDSEPKKPPPGKPNDPMYASQWHFTMVNAEQAWTRSQGAGVIVAVIDTGVSPGKLENGASSRFKRVPDLKETELVPGWNFVNKSADPSDGNGHGTHVAGTIAQSTHNGFGVAGLAFKAKIMPIKVLSDGGSGTVADIANGIRWAADHGAKVINMSLGGGMYSSTLARAVKYAHDKGVTVVCAAGNGGRQKVEYPAAYPGAVAVSALGPDGKLAFYSSYGKELAIAAPGGDTRVDLNKDGIPDGVLQDTIGRGDPSKHGFFPFQGTSMATPHVAAAAALVISLGVTDPDRVEKILKESARDLKDPIRYGAGALDAAAATQKATRDHGFGGLAIASVLGFVAIRRARKKDGLFATAKATPGFVGALVLGASGLFFLHELGLGSVPGLSLLAAPVAAWPGVLFGAGAHGFPVLLGALLALTPLAFLFGVRRARPAIAGFAFGVAGFLVVRGLLGSVDVALIPGHGFLDAAWLVVNGAFAAVLGRLALARD
jgi:serine protease